MLQLSPGTAVVIVRREATSDNTDASGDDTAGTSSVAHSDRSPGISAPHMTVQLGRLGRVQRQGLHTQIQLLATRRMGSCLWNRKMGISEKLQWAY